jgi:hypothetical protein
MAWDRFALLLPTTLTASSASQDVSTSIDPADVMILTQVVISMGSTNRRSGKAVLKL